jgi:hypothetical protein
MTSFRVNKMPGNFWHDGKRLAIADDRQFFDVLVMIANKLETRRQASNNSHA